LRPQVFFFWCPWCMPDIGQELPQASTQDFSNSSWHSLLERSDLRHVTIFSWTVTIFWRCSGVNSAALPLANAGALERINANARVIVFFMTLLYSIARASQASR